MITWENLAVLLAVVYLVLAMRESIWCWLAAFLSTAIYTVIFWKVSLLMESALNVFYMAMAVYGWSQWRSDSAAPARVAPRVEPRPQAQTQTATQARAGTARSIHRWDSADHLKAFLAIAILTALIGFLLRASTGAAWPFVDSFTTVASVIATFMVARKVLENWLYWIVIDAVSIWLYLDRGLESTAYLFVGYVVLAGIGFFQWRRRLVGPAPA